MPEWNAAYCLMKAQKARRNMLVEEKSRIQDIIDDWVSLGRTTCNIEIKNNQEEIVNWLKELGFRVESFRSRFFISWSKIVEEEPLVDDE